MCISKENIWVLLIQQAFSLHRLTAIWSITTVNILHVSPLPGCYTLFTLNVHRSVLERNNRWSAQILGLTQHWIASFWNFVWDMKNWRLRLWILYFVFYLVKMNHSVERWEFFYVIAIYHVSTHNMHYFVIDPACIWFQDVAFVLLRSVVGVIAFNMHNVNKLSNAFRFVCLFCSGSGWMNNAHCDFLEEQTRNTPVYTLWKSMHRPTRQRHLLRHIRSDPTSCWRHHYIINFSKPGALWTRENWTICWPHFDCGGDLDTSSWCLLSD